MRLHPRPDPKVLAGAHQAWDQGDVIFTYTVASSTLFFARLNHQVAMLTVNAIVQAGWTLHSRTGLVIHSYLFARSADLTPSHGRD